MFAKEKTSWKWRWLCGDNDDHYDNYDNGKNGEVQRNWLDIISPPNANAIMSDLCVQMFWQHLERQFTENLISSYHYLLHTSKSPCPPVFIYILISFFFGYVYSLGWHFCDISCILISDSYRLQAIIVGGSQLVRGRLPVAGEGSHSKVSCLPPVQDFYKEFLPTSFLWGEYILTLLRTISLHNAHAEHCSILKIRTLQAHCNMKTLGSPSHTSRW